MVGCHICAACIATALRICTTGPNGRYPKPCYVTPFYLDHIFPCKSAPQVPWSMCPSHYCTHGCLRRAALGNTLFIALGRSQGSASCMAGYWASNPLAVAAYMMCPCRRSTTYASAEGRDDWTAVQWSHSAGQLSCAACESYMAEL